MTILADFVVVEGDETHLIGDQLFVWNATFKTDNVHATGSAMLMLMVRGLTQATQDVDVQLNGTRVGTIFRHTGADQEHWYTQIINIGSGILRDTNANPQLPNELTLEAVPIMGGGGSGNNFDGFRVRDIICFFQQEV